MQEKIQALLKENQWQKKKIIVAVSGGLDSMVLAALLNRTAAEIIIAHCNFRLRGTESDGDEMLVREFASQLGVACFVRPFDTSAILEKQGGNLQETARDLRYRWFEQLRQEQDYDLIATAHHKQDSVETMLINFFKGTGIAGMHGILPQQGKIIRPLLPFTKANLEQFATAQHIPWREDSSNAKDQYTRNAIRNQLFPAIEQIFPQALEHLAGNTVRFAEAEKLYLESIERYRKKLIEKRGQDWYLPILKLRHVTPLHTILWELVKPFGFNSGQLSDIARLLEAETGKYIAAPDFRIIRNRNFLIITAGQQEESTHILIQENEVEAHTAGFSLTIKHASFTPGDMEQILHFTKEKICVDRNALTFPLVLRPWKTGDYFYPLGMNRKKKKVSRFLIEQKVPLHEKEHVWVLESNQSIVWVTGMRPDERFKVRPDTVRCVYFSVKK